MNKFLASRQKDLTKRCKREKVAWEKHVRDIPPDDQGAICAILGTLLSYNLQRVFDPATVVNKLEQERKVVLEERARLADLAAALQSKRRKK